MAEKLQEREKEQRAVHEELQSPSFIDNRVDVKAATVVTLEFMFRALSENREPKEGDKKRPKFNLLTNFGLVEGAVVRGPAAEVEAEGDQAAERHVYVTEMFQQSMDIRNEQLKAAVDEMEGQPVVVNNTGAILVEDVTITPYANPTHKIHMDHVYLFTDQIIGVTASL
ncbi:hypothetical protein [Paenibacillus thermotolerans]|uniref:hypothetical protein n=1 Tax=Paenibacillus thermotolerans TaxID=3027807 RepID=UPI002367A963|nr:MULTISPECIES: hypothetical protein [unclassified Paenibacillus]